MNLNYNTVSIVPTTIDEWGTTTTILGDTLHRECVALGRDGRDACRNSCFSSMQIFGYLGQLEAAETQPMVEGETTLTTETRDRMRGFAIDYLVRTYTEIGDSSNLGYRVARIMEDLLSGVEASE
jgi:hypothetical protein